MTTALRTLVTAVELELLRGGEDVLIIDCRFDLADANKGEREYLAAHVPGAVYAHLDRDLSDLSSGDLGRHPLPSDLAFSATLSRWGWHAGMQVVAYDEANGALAAARAWWMFRLIGHDRVAVLDGGPAAWRAAGFTLESGVTQRESSNANVTIDRDAIAWFPEVERRRSENTALLLDARASPRYRGEVEPIDKVAGHIPGAVNRPYSENLDANGRFKSPTQLRHEFLALMHGRDAAQTIHMCGSGVTACHNLLAMEHAQLAGSRVFAPSWSGWIADPLRPVEAGESPPA